MNNVSKGLIHNYKIGDAFPKHIDRSAPYTDRLYNVGIQLNSMNEYDGGDYIVYTDNKNTELISKEVGNCYYYASDVLHEVSPITKGERWSFVHHLNNNIHIISEKTNKLI
jgi:predicted 2-oxoglutarate/Fe(II)-dependent dioxygenase YbiX